MPDKQTSTCTEQLSLKDFLQSAADKLSQAEVYQPLMEARYLACSVLGLSLAQIVAKPDMQLNPSDIERLQKIIDRRSVREPAAYITGKQGFYGREFIVGKGSLIPRADTEVLIEQVLLLAENMWNTDSQRELNLLDTFTGSGCVGLTLALELKRRNIVVNVDLADISSEALTYASDNVRELKLAESVRIFQTDIWPKTSNDCRWDLITANPPYINSDVIPRLELEVREYEPLIALDGGKDGLEFYRRLLLEAHDHLAESGYLAMEHGYDQAEAVEDLAINYGWQEIKQFSDYGGRPRVTICRK